MHFDNDLIAVKTELEMKELQKIGVKIEGGHDYNRIFEAFYKLHKQLSPQASQPNKDEGKQENWQLCPKCNGDGNLYRFISSGGAMTCGVCNGNKIIKTP